MNSGSRPREVLFITGANPLRGGGGLETYVRAHALAARTAGFAAHIFCVARQTRVSSTAIGVVHEVAVPPHYIHGSLARLYSPRLERALREHIGPDPTQPVLIHAFGPYGCVGARLARTLRRRSVESVLVTSVYNTQEADHRSVLAGWRREQGARNAVRYLARYTTARAIGTRYERAGYEGSRLLLVNYESVRELLLAQFDEGWEIRTMPYTSDAAFLKEPGGADCAHSDAAASASHAALLEPRGAPLLVCVSRHDARKGVDVLLRALGQLRAAGVPFRACLLGRGELIMAHRRLAARLGLERCVAITGQVPDVRPYLRSADVFVLPSLSESSGSVSLLEALQEGLAIVASRCDGVPEDVTDGDSALLVPVGDQQALAGAIAALLRDPPLRRRLGARARELFKARFSAERFTASLAELYAELGVTPNASSVSVCS